jgi:hypothetical protein
MTPPTTAEFKLALCRLRYGLGHACTLIDAAEYLGAGKVSRLAADLCC